ncbi:hypothetical protein TNCV_2039281 [Trichonephila clavipes]|nr:hypothetical protein TNCV_2039281 [Trichonephila clavipes]
MLENSLTKLAYRLILSSPSHVIQFEVGMLISTMRFAIDPTIEDAPIFDATSGVATSTISPLRIHAAANVVELFVQTLVCLANDPKFLTQGL